MNELKQHQWSDLSGDSESAPAPGLRERNRRKKIDSILDAALAVFRDQGFEAASIEGVASLAEVSVGTVYGYFSTKENLLLGLVARHRFSGAALRRPLVEKPGQDPVEAIARYEEAVLDASLKTFDRKVWKYVQSAWMIQGQAGMGKLVGEMERRLVAERTAILRTLIAADRIAGDSPVEAIAEMLHAVGLLHWERFLADEYPTIAGAKRAIRQQIALIVRPFCEAGEQRRTRGSK